MSNSIDPRAHSNPIQSPINESSTENVATLNPESSKTDKKSPVDKSYQKTIYVSQSEIIRNFGVKSKSLFGIKPVLYESKPLEGDSEKKSSKKSSGNSNIKNQSTSIDKLKSNSSASKESVAKQGNTRGTSSTIAGNKSQINTPSSNAKMQKADNIRSQVADRKTSVEKPQVKGETLTTQELDGFIKVTYETIDNIKEDLAFNEDEDKSTEDSKFQPKQNIGAKTKNSKFTKSSASNEVVYSSSGESSDNLETLDNLKDLEKPEDLQKPEDHNSSDKLKNNTNRHNNSSKTNDKSTQESSNKTYNSLPKHIQDAVNFTKKFEWNLNNITNSANLQKLIDMNLNTRGSYAIKILMAVYKLKKAKNKTMAANLEDSAASRASASDKQVKKIKEQRELAEKAEKMSKTMSIVGIVMAVVSVIISVVMIVFSGGALTAVALAIITITVSMVGLIIMAKNLKKINIDGQEMGEFDAWIYKLLRKENKGMSPVDARKNASYINMGIQGFLALVTIGTSIGGVYAASASVAEVAAKAGTEAAKGSMLIASIAKHLPRLAGILEKVAARLRKMASLLKKLAKFSVNALAENTRKILTITKLSNSFIQTAGLITQTVMLGLKIPVDVKAIELQGEITEAQAEFEEITLREHQSQELIKRSYKVVTEAAQSVLKTLESEYQAIKLLNVKAKVA